jgi:undecaprenyl-diphosphatase
MAASIFGFYELASDLETSLAVARFDEALTRRIHAWRSPLLDVVMKVITYSAGILGMTLLALLLYLYLRQAGRSSEATATLVLVIGGVALADTFKRILRRVRPEEALALIRTPASSSFPSGHSMSALCWAMAAANAIILAPVAAPLTKCVIVALCLLYAVAVGISRVYLGVHYPSDVVAAWFLGAAWASVVVGFFYWYRHYRAH